MYQNDYEDYRKALESAVFEVECVPLTAREQSNLLGIVIDALFPRTEGPGRECAGRLNDVLNEYRKTSEARAQKEYEERSGR